MNGAHDGLPPLDPRCRISVCIPARNEAASIGPTLAALLAQRDAANRLFARERFEVIVLANNCSDATADVVRRSAAASGPRIVVVERFFDAPRAHIGTARKDVLDLAAARALAANRPDGIVASLDADTTPGENWLAAIEAEMAGCDAVAGHVTLAQADRERLFAPLRLLYDRELAYRRIFADVESLIDPVSHDPAPRHASFVGASFAVTAATYRRAGGIPPLPRLEDLNFAHALARIDARVRHSPLVRAATSARRTPRVAGGFGTFIADLGERAQRGESFAVEHPRRSLMLFELRAALRRIRTGHHRPSDLAQVSAIVGDGPRRWLPAVERCTTLGLLVEEFARRAARRGPVYSDVPVEVAIEALRAAAVRASVQAGNHASCSNAARPMRSSAASGAG